MPALPLQEIKGGGSPESEKGDTRSLSSSLSTGSRTWASEDYVGEEATEGRLSAQIRTTGALQKPHQGHHSPTRPQGLPLLPLPGESLHRPAHWCAPVSSAQAALPPHSKALGLLLLWF